MKWIKRISIGLLAILLITGGFLYYKANKYAPEYSGTLTLPGLRNAVSVNFDEYGVPHIEATNKTDMYMAFGYIHAQDRLFQMEMLRRVGSGRLAELLGEPVVKIDKLFHTIGLPEYAVASADLMRKNNGPELEDINAYLSGINAYIASGAHSPEFDILGATPQPFTLEDLFAITGAMSFSFSQAQKTEPVVTAIHEKYGDDYLRDIGLWHQEDEGYMRSYDVRKPDTALVSAISHIGTGLDDILQELPFAPLEGSNSWVVGPSKTKNKEVIFCNDTHIGYLVPQTWYEAYISCPDFELYGHFMAGVPFALVGRNSELSWGLTMLLNDDMDFYQEKIDGDIYEYKGEKKTLEYREKIVKVKGASDVTIKVPYTVHGPIVNGVFDGMDASAPPISMSWTYTMKDNKTVNAFYTMNNSKDMKTFESALQDIHAPGLSVNYGDAQGNIAWWACAHLVKRPNHVNPWTILDGASGNDDWQGYYAFAENPRRVNPPEGYIHSANNWPEMKSYPTVDSDTAVLWYPGYYKPEFRSNRIKSLLEFRKDWDYTSMETMMTDVFVAEDYEIMVNWRNILDEKLNFDKNDLYFMYDEVFDWDGQYTKESFGSTFYVKMLYHVLHEACADELGEENFKLFLATHQMQRAYPILNKSKNSPWWDNVNTEEKESRSDILVKAFEKSIAELRAQFGDNPKVWNWRKACTLEPKHPLGEVAILRPIFNIGPLPVAGGNETIMQSGFLLNPDGEYKVFFGSQMRIIVDFAKLDSALNITPCGQSGHIMSPHYDDQFEKYVNQEFRVQQMKLSEEHIKDKLVLNPIYPN